MHLLETTIYVTEELTTFNKEDWFLQNSRPLEEYVDGYQQLYNKAPWNPQRALWPDAAVGGGSLSLHGVCWLHLVEMRILTLTVGIIENNGSISAASLAHVLSAAVISPTAPVRIHHPSTAGEIFHHGPEFDVPAWHVQYIAQELIIQWKTVISIWMGIHGYMVSMPNSRLMQVCWTLNMWFCYVN